MLWFRHDARANRDAKIEKLMLRFGADGYALYWLCLELITDRVESTNLTFELEHDAETLGARLKIDTIRVEEIMRWMVKEELFELSGDTVTCMKLARRLDDSLMKSPALRELKQNLRELPGSSGKVVEVPGEKRREEKKGEERREESPLTPLTDRFTFFRRTFQAKNPAWPDTDKQVEALHWILDTETDDAKLGPLLQKFWNLTEGPDKKFWGLMPFTPKQMRAVWGQLQKAELPTAPAAEMTDAERQARVEAILRGEA